MNYIRIGNKRLRLDLDAMTKVVSIELSEEEKCKNESSTTQNFNGDGELIGTTVITNTFTSERQVDTTRYETIRTMLDIVLTYDEILDDKLGFDRGVESLPINIKIAINTLLRYGILTEIK